MAVRRDGQVPLGLASNAYNNALTQLACAEGAARAGNGGKLEVWRAQDAVAHARVVLDRVAAQDRRDSADDDHAEDDHAEDVTGTADTADAADAEDVADTADAASPGSDVADAADTADAALPGFVESAAPAAVRAVIRAENVDLSDARRAFRDSEAEMHRARHANIVAYMAVAAACEPAGPECIYTLEVIGDLSQMRDSCLIDVYATSEGRAWVEMARASRHFSAIVDEAGGGDRLTWAGLKERINLGHPGFATGSARPGECEDFQDA